MDNNTPYPRDENQTQQYNQQPSNQQQYYQPQQNQFPQQQPYSSRPSGLGGWLVLPQIGIYFTLLNSVIQIFSLGLTLLLPDEMGTLFGSGYYHPLWIPTITFEFIYVILLFAFSIFALVSLYTKKSYFPKAMIIMYIVALVVSLIDCILMIQLDLGGTVPYRTVIQAVVASSIWIPYFLKSERVANTFVN
ncbi:hypothetical protein D3C74_255350 [compost metagenome]